jgi:hypothetical protein
MTQAQEESARQVAMFKLALRDSLARIKETEKMRPGSSRLKGEDRAR